MLQQLLKLSELASWSSGYAFFIGAGGHMFKSLAGEIGQRVANTRYRCDISKGAVLRECNDAKLDPANSLLALTYNVAASI